MQTILEQQFYHYVFSALPEIFQNAVKTIFKIQRNLWKWSYLRTFHTLFHAQTFISIFVLFCITFSIFVEEYLS